MEEEAGAVFGAPPVNAVGGGRGHGALAPLTPRQLPVLTYYLIVVFLVIKHTFFTMKGYRHQVLPGSIIDRDLWGKSMYTDIRQVTVFLDNTKMTDAKNKC